MKEKEDEGERHRNRGEKGEISLIPSYNKWQNF